MKKPSTVREENTGGVERAILKKNHIFNWSAYFKALKRNPDFLVGEKAFEFFGNYDFLPPYVSKVPEFVVTDIIQVIERKNQPTVKNDGCEKNAQIEFGLQMKKHIEKTGCSFTEAYSMVSKGKKKKSKSK